MTGRDAVQAWAASRPSPPPNREPTRRKGALPLTEPVVPGPGMLYPIQAGTLMTIAETAIATACHGPRQ